MFVSYCNDQSEVFKEVAVSQEKLNDRAHHDHSKELPTNLNINILPPYIRKAGSMSWRPVSAYSSYYCLILTISDTGNQYSGTIGLEVATIDGNYGCLPICSNIYHWNENDHSPVPQQLYVLCSIFRSRQPLKDTNAILQRIKTDKEYILLSNKLHSLEPGSTSFCFIANTCMQIAHTASRHLGKIDKLAMGSVVCGFSDINDLERQSIKPIGICTRNVDFHFEVVSYFKQPFSKEYAVVLPIDETIATPGRMIPM
jgi:hypothetical protein